MFICRISPPQDNTVPFLENKPVTEDNFMSFTRSDIKQDLKSEKKHILELDYEKEVDLLFHIAKQFDPEQFKNTTYSVDSEFFRLFDNSAHEIRIQSTCKLPSSVFFHKKTRSAGSTLMPILKYFSAKQNLQKN